MRGFTRSAFRHLRRMGVAYAVLLVALFLTGLSWYYVQRTVELQNRDRFDETMQISQEAIDRQTESYVDAILGARALFEASDSVRQDEWLCKLL